MKYKNRTKKQMEYEDAPSGFVTMYNYKEPFMKFEGGFGFQGVLLFDGESDKIQCHICGEWFDALGRHLNDKHGITAADYKDKVGLSRTTALINEKFRASLIANGLSKRLQNLRQNSKKKYKHSVETKKKIGETLKKNVMELKNLRNCCPDQLISRLRNLYLKLGRIPNKYETEGMKEALKMTFGSIKKAFEIARVPYRNPGTTIKNTSPKWANIKSELIWYLKNFISVNERRPSYSDARRGLIPSSDLYKEHFGGLDKALKEIKND